MTTKKITKVSEKGKREKPIPDFKKKSVKELKELIAKNKTILLASVKNLPGSQFQEISKKLRGMAIVKVPKKNLFKMAIEESKIPELDGLKNKFLDSTAVLFSDLDGFDLAVELLNSKSPARAKAGQIAPNDITVEAGPTDLPPGPAISELGAVGLKVQIENGKISIREAKVIVKKGDKIADNACDVMSKLGIKPFSIGFVPVCTYDAKTKKFYKEISVNKEETLRLLKEAYARAIPFAVNLGYHSPETIRPMLHKAERHAHALKKLTPTEMQGGSN